MRGPKAKVKSIYTAKWGTKVRKRENMRWNYCPGRAATKQSIPCEVTCVGVCLLDGCCVHAREAVVDWWIKIEPRTQVRGFSNCDLHLSGLSFIVDRVFLDVDARSGVCRGRIKKNTKKRPPKKTEKPVRGWG